MFIKLAQQIANLRYAQINLLIAAVFFFCEAINIKQRGDTTDGIRTFQQQLHAAVIHRVIARSNFNTAIHSEVVGTIPPNFQQIS